MSIIPKIKNSSKGFILCSLFYANLEKKKKELTINLHETLAFDRKYLMINNISKLIKIT